MEQKDCNDDVLHHGETAEPPPQVEEEDGVSNQEQTQQEDSEQNKEDKLDSTTKQTSSSVVGGTMQKGVASLDPTNKRRRNIIIGLAVVALVALCVAIPLLILSTKNGGWLSSNKSSSSTGNNNAADEQQGPTPFPSTLPVPTTWPTSFPTQEPSMSPTGQPTTATPSVSPTSFPTTSPSTLVPSDSPTSTPTFSTVPANPVPENPPRGYFNYDMNDERYGPKAWSSVDTSNHFTLREFGPRGFGTWKNSLQVDPTENRCKWNDGSWQSPKDLVQNNGVIIPGDGNDGQCDSHHEIRTRCGSFPLDSDKYQKVILPHKLSIVMNRRECRNIGSSQCDRGAPPMTDYPKYSPTSLGFSDLLNFDIKIPGEHTIAGQVFDGEVQMLHAHLDNKKLNSLGIPIRAMDGALPNVDFQQILNEFHLVHHQDSASCLRQRQRRRNLRPQQQEDDVYEYYKTLMMEEGVRDGWYNNHTAQIMTDPDALRKLQTSASSSLRFDPYSYDLMPDMFFFRYWGSMTEPPCMFLTWWVMDKPMIISVEQLQQVKFLLLTHVDPDTCQRTSVHNAQQSVARPIQPIGPAKTSFIQHCTTGKWLSDFERFGYHGRRCE